MTLNGHVRNEEPQNIATYVGVVITDDDEQVNEHEHDEAEDFLAIENTKKHEATARNDKKMTNNLSKRFQSVHIDLNKSEACTKKNQFLYKNKSRHTIKCTIKVNSTQIKLYSFRFSIVY